MTCKHCGSSNIVKYGTFNGIQRYWCKDCKRKFTDNKAAPKMKTPQYIIDKVLELRKANATYAMITQQLQDMYGVHIEKACLSRWCRKYGIVPSGSSPHTKRDRDALIEKLVACCKKGTVYAVEHILAICGYSLNTKLEDTQLLKHNLIVSRDGGYIVNDELYMGNEP